MLKILHMISSGGLYGKEKVLLTLMEESTRLGLKPILGSIGKPGEREKPIETEALRRGMPLQRFRMRAVPGPSDIRDIRRMIIGEGIDLVHSHDYKPNILFGFLPRRLRPAPVVTTLHGWCSTVRFSRLWLYERLDARALAFLDGIVVVSSRMPSHPWLAGRDLPRLQVIPNAVPLPTAPAAADSDGIEAFCRMSFTFVSLGRLAREKNFRMMLQAFSLVLEQGHDVRLLILGEGDERSALQDFINRQGHDDRVLLAGYIPDAHRILSRCAAYALSSVTEGMPLCILEAITAGLPIVATSVGELPELLARGSAGLLIQPGDVQGMAAAMERIYLDAALRERLASTARQRLDKRHSALAMAQSYLEFYRQVLGR